MTSGNLRDQELLLNTIFRDETLRASAWEARFLSDNWTSATLAKNIKLHVFLSTDAGEWKSLSQINNCYGNSTFVLSLFKGSHRNNYISRKHFKCFLA